MKKARPVSLTFAFAYLAFFAAAGCGSISRVGADAAADGAAESSPTAEGGQDTTLPPGQDVAAEDTVTPVTDAAVDRRPDVAVDRGGDSPIDRGPDLPAPDVALDRPADLPVDHGVDAPVDFPVDAGSDSDAADARRDGPCVCPRIYRPVCGVDGKTYGNSCEANCAGVAIAHDGACTVDGGPSVCTTDSDCVLYPIYVGGCCGSCRGKSEPMPARVSCIIACQMPYTGCLCVNGQCTPKGGASTSQ